MQSSLYTYYFDNFVYEQGCVRRYQTDDGLMINTNTSTSTTATPSFVYHYYLKDHLGNNRVVFHAVNNSPVIDQVNNYYPLGMEYGESAEDQGETTYQNHLFSGKEFDRKFQMNFYDFGARNHDITTDRWMSVDPLCEKYYSISPYAYCANNPLIFIDPKGKWIAGTDGKPVTYENGQWSSNASIDVRNVGYSMMLTPSGTEHFNEMLSPEVQKINIKVDSQILKNGDEYDTGSTKNRAGYDKNGNFVVVESTITIHAGSIAEAVGGNNQLSGYSFDEAMGIVAGHEKGHTEVDNVKLSHGNDKKGEKNDVENRPNEIEKEIIKDLNEINGL